MTLQEHARLLALQWNARQSHPLAPEAVDDLTYLLGNALQNTVNDAIQCARAACEDVETRWESQDGYQEGASAAGECAEAVRRLLQPGEPPCPT